MKIHAGDLTIMCTKLVHNLVRYHFYSTAFGEALPAVVIPKFVKEDVKLQKQKEKIKKLHVPKVLPRGGNKAFLVISSQNSAFDFYLGHTYPKNRRIPLVSEHWMKKNTSGQKFTIHSQNENPSLPVVYDRVGIADKFGFSQFGLKEDILLSLENQGIKYPTPPQAQCIPEILNNRNVLFVAESGSGKTLAYTIPIMNSLIDLKAKAAYKPNCPFAVVIVPGKELAEQIAQEAFNVGFPCGIDVRVLVPGGTLHDHLVPRDNTNVDLLVGTFGIMDKLFKAKVFSMSNLQHVVLDEADTLLDDSFNKQITQLLQYLMAYNSEEHSDLMIPRSQLVLVSSTWPVDYQDTLCELLPVEKIVKVVSPHAHHLMSHVTHKFERVRDCVRAGVLLQFVKPDVNKNVPIMVFTNRSYTCEWMTHFLDDNGVPNVAFHAGLPPHKRAAALNDFKDGIVRVMCCTDLGSRGLNFQWVGHVINFDFPHNMSDYVHRSGRIGRVGTNHGHVTSLVNSVPGAAVVQQIEMAVRNSTGLPSIDANIKRKITNLKYFQIK